MTDKTGRIEDHPYFRWRRDGAIQSTLALAAGCIVLACIGFDTISAFQHSGTDRRLHLLFLAVAGLLGGTIVFQFRFAVLALRYLCAAAMALAVLGLASRPARLADAALLASLMLGATVLARMRGFHWAAFRAYCSRPAEIPRATDIGRQGREGRGSR